MTRWKLFNLRLPEDLHAALTREAHDKRISLHALILQRIEGDPDHPEKHSFAPHVPDSEGGPEVDLDESSAELAWQRRLAQNAREA